MEFLVGITVLLVYQLIGEVLVVWLALPVPGPVVGMLLLLLTLMLRGRAIHPLPTTANTLLSHLSLLFVPAGVGVIVHFHRLGDEWLAITLALLFGTLVTLALTAWIMRVLLSLTTKRSGNA